MRPRPQGARLPDRAVQYLSSASCVPAIRCVRQTWAACTSSCAGTVRSSPTRGGFQVFSLVDAAQDRGGGRDLPVAHRRPARSSWVRRRACASSPISARIIAMAFDECIENPAPREYAKTTPSTARRAGCKRCKAELAPSQQRCRRPSIQHQLLFGINQGGDL